MALLMRLIPYLALVALTSAFPTQSSSRPSSPARAVYFMTNVQANAVVALRVNDNGTLSDGSIISTGGTGGRGINGPINQPAGPDGTFSQGAVAVAGNTLLAVNPGSNTVSMFSIDTRDPTQLRLVGKPVDTLGDFPVTVDISERLVKLAACVGNSGTRSGVSCFSISRHGLGSLDNRLRVIQETPLQSTPPVGPANTISQTLFNADSTALITTVKGTNGTGYLSVFPVVRGRVSNTDIISYPKGSSMLLGMTNLPGTSSILASDPGAPHGALLIAIDATWQGQTLASINVTDQKATCWAAYSPRTRSVFVTDPGINRLVEIDAASRRIVSDLLAPNINPGMIDLVVPGNFLYALSPGNAGVAAAVAVFYVGGGEGTVRQIQNFEPAGIERFSAQGMAAFTVGDEAWRSNF